MATLLKLGPADHGRRLSMDEFLGAAGQEGYQYELVEGKLYTWPMPTLQEDWSEQWIGSLLCDYARTHPKRLSYVSSKACVSVPGSEAATVVRPDLAAYRDFPRERAPRDLRWDEVSPLLVVEILSNSDPTKDLVRNIDIYLRVPSIREYWIFDPIRWIFCVYRKRGRRWLRKLVFGAAAVYSTPLLPDFQLTVNPRT